MICVTTLPALPLSYYCPPVNIKPSPESQKLNLENPGRNLQCRTPPVSSSFNISDDLSPQSYAQAYLLILLHVNTELIKPMSSSPLLENSQRRQKYLLFQSHRVSLCHPSIINVRDPSKTKSVLYEAINT